MLLPLFYRLFTPVKSSVKQAKVDNQNPWVQKTSQHPKCVMYKCVICKTLLSTKLKEFGVSLGEFTDFVFLCRYTQLKSQNLISCISCKSLHVNEVKVL